MKTPLMVPSKTMTKTAATTSIISSTTGQPMRVANADVWVRGAMLLSACGLLCYLWWLVHFNKEMPPKKWARGYVAAGGILDNTVDDDDDESGLGEVYTVYTCALLLFVGISVLWR